MSKAILFEKSLIVKAEHLDEMNHVNNVQYLQWVQDVAKAHWGKNAKKEWLAQYAWVALNHFIEYKKPAFLDDELILQTYVEGFRGVKSIRIVKCFNKKTEQLLVQAKTEWCLVNKVHLKPTRVPEEMKPPFFNV